MNMLGKDTFFIICAFLSMFFLLDISFHSFQFILELLNTNSMCQSYAAMFNSRKLSVIVLFASFLLVFFLKPNNAEDLFNHVCKTSPYVYIVCIGIAFLLWKCVNMYDQSSYMFDKSQLINDLNYGKGMAYSYFYGYLKLVLPTTGTLSKGIAEKIDNYEDYHNVTFPIKKLFILIPSSQFIPPNLNQASHGWMESAGPLEDEVRTRAGVVNRTYRNSVYKIYPDGRRDLSPKYVVAEGATPVLTFFEVQRHSHSDTNLYKQYNKEIINEFAKTLKQLVQDDPDCRDAAEITCYDDYDSNGVKMNMAKIILDRIKEYENN